ncbi:MAG: hypothetical protein E6J74_02030 [Deltaproteobacteria bacterium]|nr:MAG: hypothetical protein E6J74_02030 [Deltaproteobacteria bacterium]
MRPRSARAGGTVVRRLHGHSRFSAAKVLDYHTLAGFLLARLKRIPRGGEWVEENGYKMTIVDMEGRRIVKIKLERLPAT